MQMMPFVVMGGMNSRSGVTIKLFFAWTRA